MTVIEAVDPEDIALQWLLGTSVAPLITWGGKIHVYQAMPTGSPLPCVILSLSGSQEVNSDLSEDIARITFECWAKGRPQAKVIARTLKSELKSLAHTGPVDTSAGKLQAAIVGTSFFLPDPESDLPRYIVESYLAVT